MPLPALCDGCAGAAHAGAGFLRKDATNTLVLLPMGQGERGPVGRS